MHITCNSVKTMNFIKYGNAFAQYLSHFCPVSVYKQQLVNHRRIDKLHAGVVLIICCHGLIDDTDS